MTEEQELTECGEHGTGHTTFLCVHLAENPAQEWFSERPSAEKSWPDAWCAKCDVEFQKYGEWNEKNEQALDIRIFYHKCYERARAKGGLMMMKRGREKGGA